MRKEAKGSKKYWFVWDEELGAGCAFDSFLFNEPAHLALQPAKNRRSYYLVKKHDEVIFARCTFFIEDGMAYSPFRSSFGSVEWADGLSFELVEEFWDCVEEDLWGKGVRGIVMRNYPVCYHGEHAQLLAYLLYTKGFEVKAHEMNFHIEVDGGSFEGKIHENERKKLRRCLRKSYVFRKEDGLYDVGRIHRFIDASRRRKNYPTTMNERELRTLLEGFPDRVAVYTLSYEGNWAALCVAIEVNKSILYTFYGADNEIYLKDSPLVLLHHHLYLYCQREGFRIIDLGIGTSDGIPNKGLIRFKEKIGGRSSSKMSFIKMIS